MFFLSGTCNLVAADYSIFKPWQNLRLPDLGNTFTFARFGEHFQTPYSVCSNLFFKFRHRSRSGMAVKIRTLGQTLPFNFREISENKHPQPSSECCRESWESDSNRNIPIVTRLVEKFNKNSFKFWKQIKAYRSTITFLGGIYKITSAKVCPYSSIGRRLTSCVRPPHLTCCGPFGKVLSKGNGMGTLGCAVGCYNKTRCG